MENAQTYLKLKGLEFKARKKKQEKGKGRELICSNTHGSVTEKLHSVTKQVNINEKYCILLFALISSVLLFTMTTMPLFWFYF